MELSISVSDVSPEQKSMLMDRLIKEVDGVIVDNNEKQVVIVGTMSKHMITKAAAIAFDVLDDITT